MKAANGFGVDKTSRQNKSLTSATNTSTKLEVYPMIGLLQNVSKCLTNQRQNCRDSAEHDEKVIKTQEFRNQCTFQV